MALDESGAAVAALIQAALQANPEFAATSPAAITAQLNFWTTVMKEVVTYFVTNTQVTVAVTLPPSGVATILAPTMAGPAPCTGTGTGTGMGTIS